MSLTAASPKVKLHKSSSAAVMKEKEPSELRLSGVSLHHLRLRLIPLDTVRMTAMPRTSRRLKANAETWLAPIRCSLMFV